MTQISRWVTINLSPTLQSSFFLVKGFTHLALRTNLTYDSYILITFTKICNAITRIYWILMLQYETLDPLRQQSDTSTKILMQVQGNFSIDSIQVKECEINGELLISIHTPPSVIIQEHQYCESVATFGQFVWEVFKRTKDGPRVKQLFGQCVRCQISQQIYSLMVKN